MTTTTSFPSLTRTDELSAALLRAVIRVVIGIIVFFSISGFLIGGDPIALSSTLGGLAIGSYFAIRWINQGQIRAAGVLIIGTLWIASTVGIYFLGAVSAGSYLLYIVLTALVLGNRPAIILLIVSLLVGGIGIWLELEDIIMLGIQKDNETLLAVTQVASWVWAILVTLSVVRVLRGTLELASQSEEQLRVQVDARTADLQRTTSQMESILNNNADAIVTLDHEFRVQRTNPAFHRMFSGKVPVLGLPISAFITESRREEFYLDSIRVATKTEPFYVETVGECLAQGTFDMSVLISPGAMGEYICSLRDISERKEAERQLRTYADDLERSNRELQDFAYIASHDLQEPLRKIQTFGSRLQDNADNGLGEKEQDYLHRMMNAAGRMQTLINDLLEFSRVTTKANPLVAVDLNETVEEVMSDLEVAAKEAEAQFDIGSLPTVDADPTQMRQLFQNLMGNAIKFRCTDPPHISIQSEQNGGDMVKIHVRDNGIGIEPKYSERVFQVFQRLHSRSEYDGTGIGLAICRKIVDRHGGTIVATKNEGVGSTFTIELPLEAETT